MQQIVIGLTLDIALTVLAPQAGIAVGLFGSLFIRALRIVVPILAFALVLAAIAQHQKSNEAYIKPAIILYLISTFLAVLVAVIVNFAFPTMLIFSKASDISAMPSGGIIGVLRTLLMNLVSNPISALANVNYIDISAWALILGSAVRNHDSDTMCQVVADVTETVFTVAKWVIRFAPPDIFGLVSSTIVETGFSVLKGYMHLLAVLLGSITFIALMVNPLTVWWKVHRNPCPLVFTCLRRSDVCALFIRSLTANIPVNMVLAKKLGLHEDTYSIATPLRATVNMAGTTITVTVLAMAAVHIWRTQVDFFTALLLSLVATVDVCDVSGVAGDSPLLIPLACNLFGIPNDVATQVVIAGFIIGVIQDSTETASNSSTDVLSTAAADLRHERQPCIQKHAEAV